TGSEAKHLNLVGFGDGGVTSDLGHLDQFLGTSSICFVHGLTCDQSAFDIAQADLPLFIGTDSFKIPINDPILETPQADSNDLVLAVSFNIGKLTGANSDPLFKFTINDGTAGQMPWANFSPQLPSLFALLADPSVVVDGLDQVFQVIQNLVQGQIFGVKLPL